MTDQIRAEHIYNILMDSIRNLDSVKYLFLRNPATDFTRNRKIPFDKVILFHLLLSDKTLQNELLQYYNDSAVTPTKSALCQQRDKILPEAFEFLFRLFTEELMKLPDLQTMKGHQMLATDGSGVNSPYNPDDTDSFHQNGDKKGYNQHHLNCLYDLVNDTYTDAIVTGCKADERDALITMIHRRQSSVPAIIIADRGYESYNVFAHMQESGQKFVIRIKAKDSNGILSSCNLPDGEFDMDFETILTCLQTNEVKQNGEKYTYVTPDHFDFFDDRNRFYNLKMRIVCIKLEDDNYEYLATNLPRDEFTFDDMRTIYNMRWGIETSFRSLKYTIGLVHFHGKKPASVLMELWSRLILYNFCGAITRRVTITVCEQRSDEYKHAVKVNFTEAVHVCKAYLHGKIDNPEPSISRFLIPIRPDRKAPRNVRPQSAKIFIYRAV